MYYDKVGMYPNILNEEGLCYLKEALDKRHNKTVSTESHIELIELVLKNITKKMRLNSLSTNLTDFILS